MCVRTRNLLVTSDTLLLDQLQRRVKQTHKTRRTTSPGCCNDISPLQCAAININTSAHTVRISLSINQSKQICIAPCVGSESEAQRYYYNYGPGMCAIRCLQPWLMMAPSGERLRDRGRHRVVCRQNCVIDAWAPLGCITIKALYKCIPLPLRPFVSKVNGVSPVPLPTFSNSFMTML